jgi:hypothetical protein
MAGTLAIGLISLASESCFEPPGSATPSTPLGVVNLQSHDWLSLGPYAVGNLGCGDEVVAWSTSTVPISKTSNTNDILKVASVATGRARTVAHASHGGTLTDLVPVTGSWVVYLEYRQHLQTSSADYWYLNAANWNTGAIIELAATTSGTGLHELPWYDAADGRAVWDQLDSAGRAILRLHDFQTGESTTLPIPSGMYPVQPTISGNSIVFVDNSTDPNRAHEDFLGRRGSLRRLDLVTQSITTLSAAPSAWMPLARGGEVVWTNMSSTGPTSVSGVSMNGGSIKNFGSDPVTPVTDGARVVWYDSDTLRFATYGLHTGKLLQLQVGNWQDVRSVFALCNGRLFFALPADSGSNTIRYVDLPVQT